MASLWRRTWPLRWLTTAALAVLLVLMLFEESLIFFPARYPEGNWQPRDLEFEDAWFDAADGTRLHGWYAPAERRVSHLLIAHGNAGNLAHRADLVRYVQRELGVSVLIFDYRGYGRSEGRPSEPGILADARAARQWLAARAEISPGEIVLLGESIGGAVMVELAAADGAGLDPGKHLHVDSRCRRISFSLAAGADVSPHAARFPGQDRKLSWSTLAVPRRCGHDRPVCARRAVARGGGRAEGAWW